MLSHFLFLKLCDLFESKCFFDFFLIEVIFTGLCLPFVGERLANVLCKIIDNLDTTEDRKPREEAHGASDKAKSTLQREGEVVLNLVVRGAPDTNHHNLEVVRQKPL